MYYLLRYKTSTLKRGAVEWECEVPIAYVFFIENKRGLGVKLV